MREPWCDPLFWALSIAAIALVVVYIYEVFWRRWRNDRALVLLAKRYGYDHVPGEDMDKLRAKVIAHRDAMVAQQNSAP